MSKDVNVQSSLLPKTASKMLKMGLLGNTIKETFLSTSDSLKEVEVRVTASLASDASKLTEVGTYLQELGGKRIRPLLTILSARLFGMHTPSKSLIDVAAGIELIHMATLLHDDIIDESSTRRGKPSAFHSYGLITTLLAGDFLLVRAFALCAHLDTFIIDATEEACVALTEGELLEDKLTIERNLSLSEYLTIIDKKTASLFSLASKAGSHSAGASPENVSKISAYGTAAGIAFQMIDDILDIVADEDLLGKPAGADLRQHTPSLLNILWLNSGDEAATAFFATERSTPEQCKAAMQCIKDSSILEDARKIAEDCAQKAINHLYTIPEELIDLKTRTQLEALVQYTLERCM